MADFNVNVTGGDTINVSIPDSLATVIQSVGAGSSIISNTVDTTTTLKSVAAGLGVTIDDDGQTLTINSGGLGVITTDEVTEGLNNLYFTEGRVDAAILDSVTTNSLQIVGAFGPMTWNADDGTVNLPLSADVTLQVGQENLIHVKNVSGQTITNGQVVRVTGSSGSKLTVDLANNTSDAVSADTIAVMTQTLGNNGVGYATTQGLVRGLNTASFTEGAVVWLDGAGVFTETKPLTPLHLVQVGYVVRSHASVGSIFVNVKNGWELDELHDVLIDVASHGDVLMWDNVLGYWKNESSIEWDTAYGWGDHALAGYLTSYTETDPIFTASPSSGIVAQNILDWDAAYSWGDHNAAGYLTSYSETDPIFTASPSAGITVGDISNWDNSYSWGDHSLAGYATTTDLTNQNILDHADTLSPFGPPVDGHILGYSVAAGNKWINLAPTTDFVAEGSNLYLSDSNLTDRLVFQNLDAIGDVTYLNVGPDDVLVRGATGQWENMNPIVHYDLATNTDVSTALTNQNISAHADFLQIQPFAEGQVLGYSVAAGNKWVNFIPFIGSLADVDTATVAPVVDDVLVFDGANWVPSGIVGDIDTALTAILGA